MLVSFAASAADFSDIEKHWAKEYIEFGVEKGYISGYEDGTFKPDKTVSRAEFSKMINNAIKLTAAGNAKADFKDVASKDWFFNEVKKAENAGYITGYEDGTFRPSNSVTRQEAAVILSRIVLPTLERADINKFGDGDAIDTWATDAVTMIAAKGYIKGDEKGDFLPKGALTRSQAAKLICEVVRNENIVNRNQNITSSGKEIIYSESLFTDDIVLDVEEAEELIVTFKNCRVLGSVYVKTDSAFVRLENTKVKNLFIDSADSSVNLDKSSEVKAAELYSPATLSGDGFKKVVLSGDELSSGTVKLSGDFDAVEVSDDAIISADNIKQLDVTKKVNLTLQAGTVAKLDVAAAAKGSTINLAKKVVVEKANNKSAVAYTGSGTVKNANNEVTGVTYDGVTVEKSSGKVAEGAGSVSSNDFFSDTEVSPEKGQSNRAISVNVTFTFLKDVFDKDGKKITADYIEDNFEIRKGTNSGAKVGFSAKVPSNKKITLDPVVNLANGTTYYVIIPKGTLTYEDGTVNGKAFETYFKTSAAPDDDDEDSSSSKDDEEDEDASVTMSPKSGSEDVSIDTTIKLTFNDTPKAYSSSDDFDALYVEDTIKLYEGSVSDGETVSFTATVSGKTVTLVPSGLVGNKKYSVVIPSNTIKVGGKTLSKSTLTFTTESGIPIKISHAGEKNVSTRPEIEFSFSEPVLQVGRSHDALDESYVQDEVVLFRKGSATTEKDDAQVSYSVSFAENGRKFTIVPDYDLDPGATYYIVVVAESLYGEKSGEENEKKTASFTTAAAMAPMFTPANKAKNVSPATEIKISFSEALLTYSTKTAERVPVDNEYLAELIEGDEDGKNKDRIFLRRGSSKKLSITATISEDRKTITIIPDEPLEDNKEYTVSIAAKVFYSDVEKSSKYNSAGTATFNTNIALTPTFSPRDDADEVAVNVNPTITFEEEIFSTDEDKRTLKPSYLKETALKLVDEHGNEIEFTASVDAKKITVVPEKDLEGNTEYTLTLVAGTITNEEGEITNTEQSVTFKTKVSYTYSFTPEKAEKDVSPLANPTVKFGVPVLTEDGDTVDADYAYEYIFLSTSSASKSVADAKVVPSTIVPGEDGRTFTIVPDVSLDFGKTYHIIVCDKAFMYDDDDEKLNARATSSFTVMAKPKVTVSSSKTITATSVKFTCTGSVKGDIIVEDADGVELDRKTNTKAGASKTFEFKNLEPNTEYIFNVYIVHEEEGIEPSEVVTVKITTRKS